MRCRVKGSRKGSLLLDRQLWNMILRVILSAPDFCDKTFERSVSVRFRKFMQKFAINVTDA